MKSHEHYRQAYQNPEFVRVYREKRNALYRRIAEIVLGLGDTFALDIGCSLGLLVEHLNQNGISSYGVDFDLPELRVAHAGLSCSQNFFYGDMAELDIGIPPEGSAIILLDSLRYTDKPKKLGCMGAEHLIIKEVSENPIMRRFRKHENDSALYTPADLAGLFPAYRLDRLYGSRFLFSIPKPNGPTLAMLSCMPTYTAVLTRRSSVSRTHPATTPVEPPTVTGVESSCMQEPRPQGPEAGTTRRFVMRRLSVSLLFFTGAFTLAQTPGNSPLLKNSHAMSKTADSVVLYANRPDNTGCPVGFSASRQGTGRAMTAADARQAGPAQGLHLALDRLTQPAIESIEITVYGVSSKARVIPAGPPPQEISKSFELRRGADSSSLSDADVWMQNAGSLTHVDLISIQYADGTTWHTTENLKCRAVPSSFLLIGSK